MTERKFYKTIIVMEVLSEEPIPDPNDTIAILDELNAGEYSGMVTDAEMEDMSGYEMAMELYCQGSSPEFFGLDDEGNDAIEETDEDTLSRIGRGIERQ